MSLEFPFPAYNGINKTGLKKVTSRTAGDEKGNRVNGGDIVRVCYQCHQKISLEEPIGRRDTCAACGADVRCCLNCAFYEGQAADACREPQAELVQQKDAANFCDFFCA